jgi:hypothetical protein
MNRRAMPTAFLAAALLLAGADAAAQALYATSIRVFASGGRDKVVGSLYTLNLADASAKLVAPIRMKSETAIGITGLGVHPTSGIFYGITSALSPVNPRSLVTLDVNTGDADLVGPLGAAGSDIAFDAAGTLYVWLPSTSQLGVVDLNTAAVKPLGTPGPAGNGGGIAIDDKGTAYVTPGGASGTLDRVDTHTGAIMRGPQLTGAPFPTAITAMTFTPSGLLLAVNANGGSPASVRLVAINTGSGQVTAIGSLPDDTDSLAFASGGSHDIRSALSTMSGRTLALLSLVLGLALAVGAMVLVKSLRS